MLIFYAYVLYSVSFVLVLVLGGREVYQDTKRDPRSLTWGILIGLILATITPLINMIIAVILVKGYLEGFIENFFRLMEKPIFSSKK